MYSSWPSAGTKILICINQKWHGAVRGHAASYGTFCTLRSQSWKQLFFSLSGTGFISLCWSLCLSTHLTERPDAGLGAKRQSCGTVCNFHMPTGSSVGVGRDWTATLALLERGGGSAVTLLSPKGAVPTFTLRRASLLTFCINNYRNG